MAVNYAAGLSGYVDANRLPLIKKLLFAPQSIKYFGLLTGVHGPTNLNILDTQVTFGAGNTCGWTDGATSEFSARELVPGAIKIQQSICDKAMLDYWNGYAVKVAAGRKDGNCPFEEDFTDLLKREVAKELEIAIWQGDTTSASPNLNKFDGLLTLINNDATITPIATANDILVDTYACYNAIAEESLLGTSIYMSIAQFKALVLALGNANLYHYDPKVDEELTIILPNTQTKVHGVYGLTGATDIIALADEHVIYGVSMLEDKDEYKLWYSLDNQEYRIEIDFVAGIQYAFSSEVVIVS